MAGRPKVKKSRVWCLGLSEPRHKFLSRDKRCERICPACKKRQKQYIWGPDALSERLLFPVHDDR